MRRILIAYSSRSGTTRALAREIAALCGADLEEIQDRFGRGGLLGYLRSALEGGLRLSAPISPQRRAPRAYDLVIIGTPVWAGHIASPVRSYVRRHRSAFRRVALFCTCANTSVGGTKALRELEQLCGQPARGALALTKHDIDEGQHLLPIGRFLRRLTGLGTPEAAAASSRAA